MPFLALHTARALLHTLAHRSLTSTSSLTERGPAEPARPPDWDSRLPSRADAPPLPARGTPMEGCCGGDWGRGCTPPARSPAATDAVDAAAAPLALPRALTADPSSDDDRVTATGGDVCVQALAAAWGHATHTLVQQTHDAARRRHPLRVGLRHRQRRGQHLEQVHRGRVGHHQLARAGAHQRGDLVAHAPRQVDPARRVPRQLHNLSIAATAKLPGLFRVPLRTGIFLLAASQ
jgi:hypothetical protein